MAWTNLGVEILEEFGSYASQQSPSDQLLHLETMSVREPVRPTGWWQALSDEERAELVRKRRVARGEQRAAEGKAPERTWTTEQRERKRKLDRDLRERRKAEGKANKTEAQMKRDSLRARFYRDLKAGKVPLGSSFQEWLERQTLSVPTNSAACTAPA